MWTQPRIVDLRPADVITAFFVVRRKQVKTQRDSNEPYLFLELGDASGRIGSTIWEKPNEWYQEVNEGDVVKVHGTVIDLQGRPHLSLKRIRLAQPDDPLSQVALVPVSKEDPAVLLQSLLAEAETLQDEPLRQLVLSVLQDPELREPLLRAPAAKLWHHNYQGGLLEHTLSVVELARFLADHYGDVDADLLLAGAVLHDIGKVLELSATNFVDYSDVGRLLGHIAIGAQIISDHAAEITDLSENRLTQLLHLVLSHHGEEEKGSPVKPATVEAILLHYADELDSRVAGVQRIIAREKVPGRKWSNFVKLLERFIYLGSKK